MMTWTLNGRTWGYSQADVPGQPYFLMGNQLFKTWHLLMQDLAAECAGVSSVSGLAEAARVAAVAAKNLAEAARDAAVASATDAGGSATAAGGAASAAETARAAAVAAKNLAEAARDAAAASAADAGGSATAAGGSATAANDSAVAAAASKLAAAASAAAAALDRTAAQTAATNASNSASAAAADRVTVAADKASVATALATAQALVGSAGTGTATGLVWPAAAKSLLTASDVVGVGIYSGGADTDGGAWRRRRVGSWYWEALNTATRGAAREFPRQAGWIARATSFTIYDLHDLDDSGVPKMWMVFSGAGAAIPMNGTTHAPTSVRALNGRVYLTIAGSAGFGVVTIDFVSDLITVRDAGTFSRRNANIAARNGAGVTQIITTAATALLVSTIANCVDCCVIPGGPADSAGLPIPTVAVATAGGASVIYPWGAVYDLTGAACSFVTIGPDGHIYVSGGGVIFREPLPYADRALSASRCYRPNPGTGYGPKIPGGGSDSALPVHLGDSTMVTAARGTVPLPSGLGVGWVAQNTGNPDEGMVAFAALSYATGWQPGDIRGAWLCDSATGSITGSADLISNGDFSSGTAGWAPVNATLSTSSSQLVVTRSASGNAVADTPITVTPGQTYVVRAEAAKGTTTGGLSLHISDGSVGGTILLNLSSSAASAVFLGQFTAVSSTAFVRLFHGGTGVGETALFDNVTARLALPDRSYKGRGLIPYGSLQRTALPCGLAAVSAAWGAANRIMLPPHPDFDWTGDFWARVWVNMPSSNGRVLGRTSDDAGTLTQWRLSVGTDVGCEFVTPGGNLVGMPTVPANTWTCVDVCRRGTRAEMWHNGSLVGSTAITVIDLTSASAVMYVGSQASGTGASPSGTQLALARVAAYAPTPAQIDKMHRDERALIIGGTPATLGGTSNNVTALAANDATATLAVGTADGVSVFAGLGRVQYLDGASGGAAIGNDAIVCLAASGPHMLIGTSANAGLISDAVNARDRLALAGPVRPVSAADPCVCRVQTVTTSTGAVDVIPGLYVGEREQLSVEIVVDCKSAGATASQRGTYVRRASLYRDAGGALTLQGTVETIGTDKEVTAGADVTLVVGTVTGMPAVRITPGDTSRTIWAVALRVINRISEEATYAA